MRGDQLARQWLLIQRLAKSRAGVGLDELAEELGCVRRTVYRDLDALMYAGFPVTSEKRDGKAFYRFLDRFQLGQVPFTPDELLALAFSSDLLKSLEGTVFHDSIESAMAKIKAGLGPDLARYLEQFRSAFRVLPGPHKRYAEYRDAIRTLNEAVLDRRTLSLRYRSGRSGEESVRRIDPYKVWYHGGALYVIGHDHRSGEIRTFAVDRIQGLEETDAVFVPRADFDFDAYTATSFGVVAEPATRVRIRFDRRWAAWIREREWHASQTVSPRIDGGVELVMEVGAGQELTGWILSFGDGARVLEPASLREAVTTALTRALDAYASVGTAADPPPDAPSGRVSRDADGD
ncbi:MAG: YafY family transcriptional regulator [Deltaproteobacteria bacterium]|nr:YafY family transcriptional regulator [Deltaproteobacteria bacterium]